MCVGGRGKYAPSDVISSAVACLGALVLSDTNLYKEYPWYALQVRPHREKQLAGEILAKGYECFLPLYKCKRRWSDRIKEIQLPLFSGYLFCRLDITKRLPVLLTRGVMQFVGVGKIPVPVDDREISALLAIVSARLDPEPYPYTEVGQRVQIDRGTLSGFEGIVQHSKKSTRLIVSVSLLQRSVSVEIDEAWVTPLGPALKARRMSADSPSA